jgi:transposase
MAFLIHVMYVLDKHSLKGCNLVIDNAPIHKPEKTTEEANKRGYRIIYLPPYSPFSNPIEEFWAKVKILVRRFPMTDRDNLVASIREAAEKVTPEDCQDWVRHPESFFERCLNKEELL